MPSGLKAPGPLTLQRSDRSIRQLVKGRATGPRALVIEQESLSE